MVDLLAIAQGFQAIRSASDIAQTMIGLRDSAKLLENTVELNRKIAEAQSALFAAQQEQATLVKAVDDLEKEVARLKAWDREKKNYELAELPPGVWVRRLKESAAEPGKPVHSICANCYEDDKISILQSDEPSMGIHHLTCNRCSAKLEVGHYQFPQINYPSYRD